MPPFDPSTLGVVNQALTPEQAARSGAKQERVLWGGVIVSTKNAANQTELVVLVHPVGPDQRPQLKRPSQGRVIVYYPQFLEPLVYVPGREVTVLGTVQGVTEGKVGDATYTYPVVDAERVYLWPVDRGSRVRFGVGVGVGVRM